ncbi:MAG: hypothetical protein ABJF50_07590 [Paracoccaceae bacterium]
MLIDAMIVEGVRTKSIDETDFMILLEQEMGAFQNNKNMSNQETFGAITSVLDMIKRAKEAKSCPETAYSEAPTLSPASSGRQVKFLSVASNAKILGS